MARPKRWFLVRRMPRISEFFGIVIRMYYNDHLPHTSMPSMVSTKPFTRLKQLRS